MLLDVRALVSSPHHVSGGRRCAESVEEAPRVARPYLAASRGKDEPLGSCEDHRGETLARLFGMQGNMHMRTGNDDVQQAHRYQRGAVRRHHLISTKILSAQILDVERSTTARQCSNCHNRDDQAKLFGLGVRPRTKIDELDEGAGIVWFHVKQALRAAQREAHRVLAPTETSSSYGIPAPAMYTCAEVTATTGRTPLEAADCKPHKARTRL